jgi:hypothetical protein
LFFLFATPALVGAVHPRSRPPSCAVEELLATFMVNKVIILLAGSKGLSRSMVLSRSAAS